MNIFNESLPKVPYERILSEIAEEHYFNLDKAVDSKFDRLRLTTICVLVMKNGFVVTGQSATNDANNYSEELGKKYSKEKAINELWGLIAYQDRTIAMNNKNDFDKNYVIT